MRAACENGTVKPFIVKPFLFCLRVRGKRLSNNLAVLANDEMSNFSLSVCMYKA